jgi:hypothetical protein
MHIPHMGGQRKIKSSVHSITRESHDDIQSTRQLSVALEELDKINIYIRSNNILLERKNFADY